MRARSRPRRPGPGGGGADSWEPAKGAGGTALYWLADRGEGAALGVAGAELVALLKAADGGLAARSERSILKAALDARAVSVDRRHPDRWSQMVKVAKTARRLVVIPLSVIFGPDTPADASDASHAISDQPPGADSAASSETAAASPETGASRVPPWLMDRVDRLDGRARAVLLGGFRDAGVSGRRLSHDGLVAVEGWVARAEAAPTAASPSAGPPRRGLASRPTPAPPAPSAARRKRLKPASPSRPIRSCSLSSLIAMRHLLGQLR